MQYDPKLKKAMEEIKEVLKKHDIAGYVVIHSQNGFIEYLNHLNPSYSCAFLQDVQLRVKLKTAELPGGQTQAKYLAEKTYNMISLMTDIIVMHASGYIDFQKMLKEKWGGEEGTGNHSAHEHQNN